MAKAAALKRFLVSVLHPSRGWTYNAIEAESSDAAKKAISAELRAKYYDEYRGSPPRVRFGKIREITDDPEALIDNPEEILK